MKQQYSLIAKKLALIVFFIGVFVIIGWIFDLVFFKSIDSGIVSMKVNAAIGFLLSGMTLWLINDEKQNNFKKTVSIVFPILIILLGGLTLVQFFINKNFGIDELLFNDIPNAIATSSPGRMSPTSAFCFVLLGMSFLLLYKKKAFHIFQFFTLITLGFGFLSLIGYYYRVSDFQGGFTYYTKMALHSSIAIITLSIGLLCSNTHKGIMSIISNKGITGIAIKHFLPVIIIIPLILGWLNLQGIQKNLYDLEVGIAFYSFISIVILTTVIFIISDDLLLIDKRRKIAESQLKVYKHFFNNSNDLSCIANTKGYFDIINPQFTTVLGYAEKEILENNFLYFTHPDDAKLSLQEALKLKNSDSLLNFTNRFRKKDGSYIWLEWNLTKDTVSKKIYGIARDITERKKVENEFEVITEKLKEAQSLAKVGSWDIDLENNTSYWSEETFKILDLDPETTNPSIKTFFSCIYEDDLENVKQHVNKIFTNLLGFNFNTKIKGKDDFITHALIQSTMCFDSNNKPIRLFGIIKDITEIKNAEDKLIEINKELESFSYSVSHDLRAPLRAINGYAHILCEDHMDCLDNDGKRIIETIKQNASKMGILINDLLAFSRLGRKEVQKTEIDMNKLTESVILEMNKTTYHKAIINTTKLHNIKADYNLLHQVMTNIVSNAVKYSSKHETPLVSISSKEMKGEIVYTVNDNGAGFDMQYADKLFGVFQRLHSDEEFEGVGVGLAIVQRIITKHGGKVWAEGKINKGAKFNFSLTKN